MQPRRRPLLHRSPGEFVDETGLADTGLTHDYRHGAARIGSCGDQPSQFVEFSASPHEFLHLLTKVPARELPRRNGPQLATVVKA